MTDLRALPCPLCGSCAVVVHRTGGEARRLVATCMEAECACSADFVMWQARPAFATGAVRRDLNQDFQGQTQGQNEGAGTNAASDLVCSIANPAQSGDDQSNEPINPKTKAP